LQVFFWMGAPAALALAYVRIGNLVVDRNSYEAVNAGWLIMPISLFLSAIVGCYVDAGKTAQRGRCTQCSCVCTGINVAAVCVLELR
jgi:hypothetical protein